MKVKSNKRTPPTSIKIISTIIIIYSIWFIVSSLIGFTANLTSDNLLQKINEENPGMAEEFQLRFENRGFDYNEATVRSLLIFGSVLALAMGTFVLSLGILLWKGKNWARITIVVISFFLTLGSLVHVLGGNLYSLIDTAAFLFLAFFLLLNKSVKSFYLKRNR